MDDSAFIFTIWQEFAPSDEELQAYRKGEEWDPEKAKLAAKQKVLVGLQIPQSVSTIILSGRTQSFVGLEESVTLKIVRQNHPRSEWEWESPLSDS